MFCFVLVTFIILYFIIAKGIKVSGKVAIFTVIGPYVLLFILFCRVLSLEGSWKGIKYVLVPEFSKLFNFSVWQSALNQSFFQNNIGYGTLMTFASFRNKKTKIQKSSLILICANFFSAVFSAVIVFGYLGYFSTHSNIEIEKLPLSGPTLVFVTYPASLAMMPFPRIWLVLFFFTMLLLTIDSELGLLECLSYFLIDLKNQVNKFRKYIL